jgi:hypothetical protein
LALLDGELDVLSLFQVPEAIASDCREMDKDIGAFLPLYKPIALGSIEPLDGSSYSFRHFAPFTDFVRRKAGLVVSLRKHPDS